MKKSYYLNKDLILGAIFSKGITVTDFCSELGVNRSNFYQYLNREYTAPRSKLFSRVAKTLGFAESLLWSKGE